MAAAHTAASASIITIRRRAGFMPGRRVSELKVNKWRWVGHLEQARSGKRRERRGVEVVAPPFPAHDGLAVGAAEHHEQAGHAFPQLGRTDPAAGPSQAV